MSAAADPIVHYNWDRDEPFVRNKNYEGPGIYTQTLSITGLPPGSKSFALDVLVNSSHNTSWDFFPFGCAGPTRLGARPFVADCDTIPGLEAHAQYLHLWDSGADELYLLFSLDPAFVADPQRRYGLATITFDLQVYEACIPPIEPLCFMIGPGVILTVDSFVIFYPEHDRLTWNDASDVPDCRARRPSAVRPSSWGRVKALYR
jgi:hypothetical protein